MKHLGNIVIMTICLTIAGAMVRAFKRAAGPQEIKPERTNYSLSAPEFHPADTLTDLSTQPDQYLFRNICPKKWHCTNLYISHYPPKHNFVVGEFEFDNRENISFRVYPEEITNDTPNRAWEIRAVQVATNRGENYVDLQRPRRDSR